MSDIIKKAIHELVDKSGSDKGFSMKNPIYAMKCIQQVLKGKKAFITSEDYHQAEVKLAADLTLSNLAQFFSPFYQTSAPLYVVSNDFRKALLDTKLSELTHGHLPKRFCGIIRLDGLTDPFGETITEIAVFIGSLEHFAPEETISFTWLSTEGNWRSSWALVAHGDDSIERSLKDGLFAGNELQAKNVITNLHNRALLCGFSSIESMLSDDYEGLRSIKALRKSVEGSGLLEQNENSQQLLDSWIKTQTFIFNVLAYINSGDPDLREFKQPQKKDFSSSGEWNEKRKLMNWSPVFNVGFGWNKTPLYTQDEWDVIPHFRWQRFGVNLSQAKLIFIEGHRRQRKAQEAS